MQHSHSPNDPACEPQRPDAQGAAPIVGHDLPIHTRMLARHVFEHGLVHQHLANRKRHAQGAQRHEYKRDEKRRQGDGHKIQREIDERSKCRSHHEPHIPLFGVERGEIALPEHEHARTAHTQKHPATGDQNQRGGFDIHRRQKACRAKEHKRGGKQHQHPASASRKVVRPQHARNERAAEGKRLRKEKRERDFGSLELQRQKRKHAAPNGCGVHRKEARIPPTRHVRAQKRLGAPHRSHIRRTLCHVRVLHHVCVLRIRRCLHAPSVLNPTGILRFLRFLRFPSVSHPLPSLPPLRQTPPFLC